MTDSEIAVYLMTLPARDRLDVLRLLCFRIVLATTRPLGVALVKHSQN